MRARRLVVWCVVVLFAVVPAVRFAWTPTAGAPHHDSVKSPRSAPSGWRTVTDVPTLTAVLPVLGAGAAAMPLPRPRLTLLAPAVPFVPPRV
ncbi:MAG TPA: hypothetical protein VGL09_06835 [Methylomirabilota bacterium]